MKRCQRIRALKAALLVGACLQFSCCLVALGEETAKKKSPKSKPASSESSVRPLPPPSDKTYRGFTSISDWRDLKHECLSAVLGIYLAAYDAHLRVEGTLAPLEKNLIAQQELIRIKQTAIESMVARLEQNPYQPELAARIKDEKLVKEGMIQMLEQSTEQVARIAREKQTAKEELGAIEANIAKIFVVHIKRSSPLTPQSMFAELRSECLRFPRICDPVKTPAELMKQLFGDKIKDSYCLEYMQAVTDAN